MTSGQLYASVARAFDQAAPGYDELYGSNPIMAWLRRENMALLSTVFPPGSRLLDIGCGTGDEALALSRLGCQIVATDISAAMIAAARAKSPQGSGVAWHVLPAGDLADLTGSYGPAAFDGAYASFGAMNCEPRLDRVAAALAGLLRPAARFVCSVMNRWCAWEIAWGLLHAKPGLATRRLRKHWTQAGLAASPDSPGVPVRYYSPREFAGAWAPYWHVEAVHALPVLLPPPYLAHLAERHPRLLAWLGGAERRWRGRWPLSNLGDHFVMVLVQTGPEEG